MMVDEIAPPAWGGETPAWKYVYVNVDNKVKMDPDKLSSVVHGHVKIMTG